MVATRDPNLRAVVLVAGIYDLAATYRATLPGIRRAIEKEAGASARAFAERSAIHGAERIRAATLILHGTRDDRVPSSQTEAFAAAVERGQTVPVLELIDCSHNIPARHRREILRPFYDQVFA